jgi:hypothetical protein
MIIQCIDNDVIEVNPTHIGHLFRLPIETIERFPEAKSCFTLPSSYSLLDNNNRRIKKSYRKFYLSTETVDAIRTKVALCLKALPSDGRIIK